MFFMDSLRDNDGGEIYRTKAGFRYPLSNWYKEKRASAAILMKIPASEKPTRYNSQSVLSGLLVCAECNHNYRRITHPSGEIVLRCASRVEHGKGFCKHSPSASKDEIENLLCKKLNMITFDEKQIKNQVDTILVYSDNRLQIELQNTEYFELLPN